MKNRTNIIGFIALLLSLIAFFLLRRSRGEVDHVHGKVATRTSNTPNYPSIVQSTIDATTVQKNLMQAMMQTPIVFYCIVLDQDGKLRRTPEFGPGVKL